MKLVSVFLAVALGACSSGATFPIHQDNIQFSTPEMAIATFERYEPDTIPFGLGDLIRKYERYCNEIVKDTVIQLGVIKERFEAIGNGFYRVRLDTTWTEVDCPEYKHKELLRITKLPPSNEMTWPEYHVVGGEDWVARENMREVARDYICECKRREIVPFSDHFWEWVKGLKA